jgi:hypothetical protein
MLIRSALLWNIKQRRMVIDGNPIFEDGTDTLCRDIGKGLQFNAA